MVGLEGQDDPVTDQSVHGVGFVDPTHNFLIQSPGYRVGLYVQDEWQIARNLAATLGVREDRNNVTGTKASPRTALIWQATPATTLKALYGDAHRAPNAYERDYGDGHSQIANPALRGESIDTLELVADQRIARDFALRASLYSWRMSDLITQVYDPASGIPPQYQSGEEAKAHGLELSSDKTWDSGARLRDSVALQEVSYVDNVGLLNSPKLLAKLNLSTPLPLWGLRAGYEQQYDSSRLSRDGAVLGGYALTNLVLSADRLAKGLLVSAGIYNLLNKSYEEPGALNNWQNAFMQDGRSVRVTATQRF
jgi:iron complex outermembrane receptor protein